ncbi:hypothetical protein HELRODRAFT_110038 [Helobdella robusta]|uniref:RNA helicase n=1 Tax=Helobdella robusta TaxID=6412 RepID=T1EEY5_HELRO|nr:hypothetical protein HELRODRAFT_110038 [Helobdella robusta]ESO09137.1 hypothetical protein HELRODRAFT_110038 [Helobdella robusta]
MWGSSESAVQRPNGINNSGQGGGGNQSNKYQGKNVVCVGEELKIAVNLALERFRLSEDMQEFDFPSSLKSNERAYVHNLCVKYGFKSRSKGKKSNRILTVMKKDLNSQSCVLTNVDLVRNSRNQIQNLLQKHPLTVKERQELQQRNERNQMNESMMKEIAKTTTGRLNNGMPQVPPPKSTSPEFLAFQDSLPVSKMKDVIVKTINENKVILISGETGSGKTTQIPQLILNDCHANNKACRIFCTQPRRLSALTIAERVAAERGEKIGHTVGYQIRLESRVSPKTILTFCTNGVLLRTLMAGSQTISDVTHILVDEVHERDRFCDFLLTVLKDLLPRMKHLKLVLMSANINTQLFSTYFTGCPILQLAGRMFDVQELFLEDILKWTNYTNKEMEKRQQSFKFSCNNNSSSSSSSHNNNNNNDIYPSFDYQNPYLNNNSNNNLNKNNSSNNLYTGTEREELEPWLVKEWDDLLAEIWLNVKEEIFSQIFHLILNENVNVDHRHSEMSVTPLMVAAGRGFISVVEKLLNMGANVHVRSSNDWRAIDWAQKFDQAEVVELIEAHIATLENSEDDDANLLKFSDSLTKEDKELLSLYHSSFDDDKVDVDLIICLLQKIHSLQQPAILVFLPGYDEIMTLRERIVENRCFAENARYILYTLHSQMQSSDQKNIFKVPESGTRKIILSTNIAETSITINDVVFVIDSGKVKMKSYDALTSVSMLKTQWISKSSVSQRSGRAGRCRPGVAYHLFSSVRYQHMQEYPLPELVCYPLQELCLHTKLLASPNCKIADFLSKAPEPPAFLITKNAVHLLKQIDALDPFEDLTELGHHLADLPIEPKYGKMILYSVVLKCLDPILTIACSLAYKDPFLLPSLPHQKRAAAMSRRRFAAGTCSDHMALLRAFQSWQKARSEGWEKSFCNKNFLSSSTMEMIVSMRLTQLLGQLRAAGFVRARGGGDIRDLNSNSENWSVVKAALCAGMYPNLIKVNKERSHLITNKESKIRFHSSSVLGPAPNEVGSNMHNVAVSRLPTDWLAFEEMTRMHRTLQVKSCTAISPITVALFAGPAKLPSSQQQQPQQIPADSWHSDSEQEDIKDDNQPKSYLALDDWIKFSFEPGNSTLIVQLRLKWHSLFMRRMKAPTKLWSPFDETTIKTIVNVLTNEEHALGLQQPAGIGQRPRPMCSETSVMSGGSKELSSSSSSLSSLPGAAELSNNQDGSSSAAKNCWYFSNVLH